MKGETIGTLSDLRERLEEGRQETDKLFELVKPEFLYERPIPERHRIIFYMGHLEAFDWNLLNPRMPNAKVFDREFDRLFAFGIDPVEGGLPSDQPSDWPARPHIERYRDRIRSTVDSALSDGSPSEWAGGESSNVLLNVMIEHRLMHAETLAYMLHQLPLEQKRREAQALVPQGGPAGNTMIEIPSGSATLGMPREDASFGWDNEYDVNVVDVPGFTIDQYKVTNGQYLDFVQAGGYQDRRLWSAGGWDWKEKNGLAHPVFWSRAVGDSWSYRGMFEEVVLPLHWPVYVSHAEASAYAAWAGKRLPTEAEWHRAAYGAPGGVERKFPWGAEPPSEAHGFFKLKRWDPAPVNAFPAGRGGFDVAGTMANGWEWTSSNFAPFPGFRPFPFYEGYSANFFDGQHFVIKGGSPRTAQCMLRRSFRNWFQPHYQDVYAGFRCAGK